MTTRDIMRTLLFMLIAVGMTFAQSRRSSDEDNTIAVFKQARSAVVHMNVSFQESREHEQNVSSESVGTGFVIDREGHILSNYHVIEKGNRVEVHLPGGRRTIAKLIGTAPSLDLALLQVELTNEDGVVPIRFGNSDAVEVGQKVILVGNPMALHNTLTVGVLSALNRTLPGAPADLDGNLIQTDAAINPGSSGGPILDSAGHVIGLAIGRSAEGQNLGFAIPINLVKCVLNDLIETGHPYRPALGLDVIQITPQLAELFGLPLRQGVLVQEVFTGSPAHTAGLRAGDRTIVLGENTYVIGGDIITAINGQPIPSLARLRNELLKIRPKQKVTLRVLRHGEVAEIVVPLH